MKNAFFTKSHFFYRLFIPLFKKYKFLSGELIALRADF